MINAESRSNWPGVISTACREDCSKDPARLSVPVNHQRIAGIALRLGHKSRGSIANGAEWIPVARMSSRRLSLCRPASASSRALAGFFGRGRGLRELLVLRGELGGKVVILGLEKSPCALCAAFGLHWPELASSSDHRISAPDLDRRREVFARLNTKTSRTVLDFYKSRKIASAADSEHRSLP